MKKLTLTKQQELIGDADFKGNPGTCRLFDGCGTGLSVTVHEQPDAYPVEKHSESVWQPRLVPDL